MRTYRAGIALILALAALLYAQPARAQFIGFTSPQTTISTPYNNVVPTPGQCVAVQNLGQNVHFLSYTVNNPAGLQYLDIRMDGTIDGTNFFPISDDAVGTAPNGSLYAIGYYAKVCVRVADFQQNATATLHVTYSGSSATSGPLLGTYSKAQTNNKSIFSEIAASSFQEATFASPTGSSLGYLFIFAPTAGNLPAGSTIQVVSSVGSTGTTVIPITTLSTTLPLIIGIPDSRGSQIDVQYGGGGASATLLSMVYVFVDPASESGLSGGTQQPLNTFNTETVSAVNTTQTKNIIGKIGTRVHIFQIGVRCGGAGIATVTVEDGVGGSVIFETVNTSLANSSTISRWAPGLATAMGNGASIIVGSCGDGTASGLDIQASQF